MNPNHDLIDFLQEASRSIEAEYERVRKRSLEDPGTAGDQGEENWATVFKQWLPSYYHVVTKGRIIGASGAAGPQVDVLILKPSYPLALLDKKLYLAGGVAAAFECKLTLTARDVRETVENAARIQRLAGAQFGTPYRELFTGLIYGLLAHSHSWKETGSAPAENIERSLMKADEAFVEHPREMLDVLCVADLAVWNTSKQPAPKKYSVTPDASGMNTAASMRFTGFGVTQTNYNRHTFYETVAGHPPEAFTPIGALLQHIQNKLAFEDHSLRSLATYFRNSPVMTGAGGGSENVRLWPNGTIAVDVVAEFERRELEPPKSPALVRPWDEWHPCFM